jgi:outer membrane protein assembly factor BamB
MRRSLPALLVALTALLMAATPALAAPFPTTIDLPNGWAPEGITGGRGTTAYVGSLANGAIARVDLRTGAVDGGFIDGVTGEVAVGLEYEAGAHRLWAAGGPTGEVRAYDAADGTLLETYTFTAGFVNDVVATRDAIYATDSAIQQLLVVPLGADGSLPAPADAFAMPIIGDFVYEAGFNANGIVAFGGRLIVPQSNTGELFAIEPATGHSVRLLPEGSITFADGLELVGSTLYVMRNQLAEVAVYRFHGGTVAFRGTITGDGLDVPTTIAFAAGRLWAVNARFGTPVTPDTAYWITRLPTR